ncbi:MAG TPA: ATPase, T2SS/T4P/T4SS family [Myxococcales bacterium]|jgi:twitching motility protein PilT
MTDEKDEGRPSAAAAGAPAPPPEKKDGQDADEETTDPHGASPFDLLSLLRACHEQEASDLLLTPGAPPTLRLDGALVATKHAPLESEDAKRLCRAVMNDEQLQRFASEGGLRFSFGVRDVARFRGQVYRQRSSISGVFHRIGVQPRPLASLELPRADELVARKRGLVLVASPAGEGRSTTLASLVDKLNEERGGHIVTLEAPIEIIHGHKKSLVDQIELGTDASAERALELIWRAAADVVVFGDLDSPALVDGAVALAEAGKLVLGCVAATSSAGALSRVMDLAPAAAKDAFPQRLARALGSVVFQVLLPKATPPGKVVAFEVVDSTEGVRAAIRDGSVHHRTGFEDDVGAHPLQKSIDALVEAGKVQREAR